MTKRPEAARRARCARRAGRSAAFLAAVAGSSACDLPTAFPEWETTWVVPAEEARIELGSLLPPGVTIVAGPAFELSLSPASDGLTLGEACGPGCGALDGLVAPKPAFTLTIDERIGLPPDVVSATLAGGTVGVVVRHDLGFDPLRPSATARGSLVVTARVGTRLLASDSTAGETTAFPSGTPLAIDLPLAAAEIDGPIDVAVRLRSPAGDPVRIDTDASLTVTATPESVRLSEVRVRADGRPVSAADVALDFAGVDEAVVDRVRRGALRLRVSNPIAAAGPLALRLVTPTRTIDRSIDLQPGTTETRVELSGEEIRSILGSSSTTLSVTGALSGAGGVLTARPDQVVAVESRLELVLVPVEDE